MVLTQQHILSMVNEHLKKKKLPMFSVQLKTDIETGYINLLEKSNKNCVNCNIKNKDIDIYYAIFFLDR